MPPKKTEESTNGENGGSVTISPGDVSLIDAILKNCTPDMKPGAQANWDNVATQLESKSAHSVKERFRVACKKYGWFEASSTSPSSSPKKKNGTKATTPSKKRSSNNVSSDADEADDVETKPTPAKKRKRAPKGKKKEEEAKPESDESNTSGDSQDAPAKEDPDLVALTPLLDEA
ncbi:uncharacterized protein F4822DRAFT_130266 [Hypoxylon trugodes]|uniref:uncharacterized protein n=1 Tax=Hypoxylon trugodes TaxID=326681 RepID=UPI002194341C|nr:uncharacterized protein F4822DRAFT_130266 [Hypoxylon trugodes]KAI1392474.1 hypothetical protein F4822DRAFT_130266 [Hypoxylon trugodes]